MRRSIGKTTRGAMLAIASAAAVLVVACGGDDSVEPATVVMRGGRVHTMDEKRTVASAIALRGDRIVAVGTDAEITRYVGAKTEVINLNGRMVLPGFIDTHIHSAGGSQDIGKCSMGDAPLSIDEIRAAVQDCIANSPPAAAGEWLQVVSVNPAGLVMNKADLDRMLADRPMMLQGSDHHTAWVNSAGLALTGVTAATPDPAGGSIERDARGQPTGFFKDGAIDLISAVIPDLTLAQHVERAKLALAQHNSFGITSIQDPLASPEILAVYAALEKEKALSLRVRADLASEVGDDEAEISRLKALRSQYASGHPRLRVEGVKIFADGVIEYPTQTAALLKPYRDDTGRPTTNYGGRYFDQAVLNRYVTRLDAEGFSLHVHAIGDATTRAVLDAFDAAKKSNGSKDNRHQIAHLQLVDPADIPRFAPLGVIANMQLLWAIPDVYSIDALQPFIDATAFQYMYPAGSLKKAGAMLVGGSDWPVSTENPLLAIEHAVLRANPETGQVLNPAERVTLDDMLAAYTINAAKALKQESSTGSLEAGKQADLVVLDRDLSTLPSDQIHTASVQLTMLDGQRLFDAAKASASALKRRDLAARSNAVRIHQHGRHDAHAQAAPNRR